MENDGLSTEQTEKVLQLQDVIGIDDIGVCRDILTRHQWDLEVAIQEQLNLREGRPSMFVSSAENREPQVINDGHLQRVFVNSRTPVPAPGFPGFLGFIFNYFFSFCYNTFSSILSVFRELTRGNERSKFGFVVAFVVSQSSLMSSQFNCLFRFVSTSSCHRSISRRVELHP